MIFLPYKSFLMALYHSFNNTYPMIKKVRVDGIYGSSTRESVEMLQRIFGMPVTGIVDFGTWYRISNIYVAVTRMAELR